MNKKWLLTTVFLFSCLLSYSGPPFFTDDPQPVDFHHWEYYLSTTHIMRSRNWEGTSPHVEINYGLVPNVQLHLLMPMNYSYDRINGLKYGYASTEMGVKYRFIQEREHLPQIGIFPIIEMPTVQNENFSNGRAQIYLPVWIQKSFGKLTTYGGAGYWINPGPGNRNWVFSGWEVQYDFTSHLTLGSELYYHSSDAVDSNPGLAFNLGGLVNFSEKFHFIFSLGHSITNENFFSSYLGLLWTI